MNRWDKLFPLLKDRIEELQRQIDILKDHIAENQTPTTRKRGRPRKTVTPPPSPSPTSTHTTPEELQESE